MHFAKTLIAYPLLACVVASAQVMLPVGSGLDPYLFPPADTIELLERGVDSLPHPDSAGFASIVKKWTDDRTVQSVVVDTGNRVLRYSVASTMVVVRKDGVVVEVRERYADQEGTVDFSKWLFDASGHRVNQVFGFAKSGKETRRDSIEYSWRLDGCADEVWADTKRVWTVDAEGRCQEGAIQERDASQWRDVGLRDAILWENGRLGMVVELEKNGSRTDTILKDVYSHGTDGNWTGAKHFERLADGEWILRSQLVNVWADGKFLSGLDTEFDDLGREVWRLESTPRASTGVRDPGSRRAPRLSAIASVGGLVFENRGDSPAIVRIATAQGRELGEFTVESGSRAIWNRSELPRVVLWNSAGQGWRESGRALVGR